MAAEKIRRDVEKREARRNTRRGAETTGGLPLFSVHSEHV